MDTHPPADLDFLDQWSRGCLYARHFLEVQAAVAELRRLREPLASPETLFTAGPLRNAARAMLHACRVEEGAMLACRDAAVEEEMAELRRLRPVAEAVEPDPHLWEHGEGLEGGR